MAFGKPKACDICGSEGRKMYKALDGSVCETCFTQAGYRPMNLAENRIADNIMAVSIESIKVQMEYGTRYANSPFCCKYVQGLPIDGLFFNIACGFEPEELVIKTNYNELAELQGIDMNDPDAKTFRIPYTRILAIDTMSQTNIQEKNKSVIGRGIVGGLLFGPAGAVIGGISGIGTKTVTTTSQLFVVAYTEKDGGIANIIGEMDPRDIALADQFIWLFNTYYNKNIIEVTAGPETNEDGDIIL